MIRTLLCTVTLARSGTYLVTWLLWQSWPPKTCFLKGGRTVTNNACLLSDLGHAPRYRVVVGSELCMTTSKPDFNSACETYVVFQAMDGVLQEKSLYFLNLSLVFWTITIKVILLLKITERTNPSIFLTLFNNKWNSLQRCDIAKKNREFYTEWLTVCPDITSKFCTITLFKSFVK
jgi:hypothetical protein